MEAVSCSDERTALLIQELPEGITDEQNTNQLSHIPHITENGTNKYTAGCSYAEPQQLPVAARQASFQHHTENNMTDNGSMNYENFPQQYLEKEPEAEPLLLPVTNLETGKKCFGGTCLQRVYICFVVYLYYFAIMMDDEAWPQLVRSRVVRDMGVNLSQAKTVGCSVNYTAENSTDVLVQKRSATINTYFLMAAYIPAIFSNLVIGRLTDKFGRKLGLFTAIAGAISKYSFIAVCIHFDLDIDISFAGFVLYGLSGTYTVISQTSNAYAADITVPGTDRTFFFAIVSFFRGSSSLLGQLAAGYIIQYVGQFFIYIIAIGTMVCTFFIVAFCFSKSGSGQQRNEGDLAIQHCEQSEHIAVEVHRETTRSTRTLQGALLVAYILTCLRDLGITTVASLFLLDSPFCWTSVKIGWLLSMITGCKLVGLFLVGLFQKCASDVAIVTTGTILTAASYFIFTFASNDLMVFSVPVVDFLGDVGYPLTSSMMSGVTSPDKQGFLFSLLGVVESVGTLCSGLGLNTLYFATVGWMNGFVFLLAAVICLLCVPLYMYYMAVSRVTRVDGTKTTTS